mgnify:CR=1 FL=1
MTLSSTSCQASRTCAVWTPSVGAFNVTISDVNDRDGFVMSEGNCRVMKMPDTGRQKTEGSVTVNIFVPSMTVRQ